MKNFLFTLTLLLTSICYSQKPTTLEEYNYLTKGYKVQIESGLDMKAGYSFIDVLTQKINNDVYEFKVLKKDGYQGIRALFIIARPAEYVASFNFYLCIPVNNSELFAKYVESIRTMGKQTKENLLLATTIALSSEIVRNYRSPDTTSISK